MQRGQLADFQVRSSSDQLTQVLWAMGRQDGLIQSGYILDAFIVLIIKAQEYFGIISLPQINTVKALKLSYRLKNQLFQDHSRILKMM